jgi:hypothetical protein
MTILLHRAPLVLAALVSLAIGASSARAESVTVSRCTAAKVRCVMGYTHVCGVAGVLGQFKCYQNATMKTRFVDQVCVNRTFDKITECFQNAERRYNDCLTLNDVVAVHERIEAFVLDAVEDVTPGFPYPITNRCASGKQQTIAEATAAKLGCYEDAFRRAPGTVDPACYVRPESQYAYQFAKLEGNGGCLTSGDDAVLQQKIDTFVAEMIDALDP